LLLGLTRYSKPEGNFSIMSEASSTTTNVAVQVATDVASTLPTAIDAVQQVEKIGGADGTDLQDRVSGLEALINDVVGTLTHLFPGHFGTPKSS
jgi:hypothetical protein